MLQLTRKLIVSMNIMIVCPSAPILLAQSAATNHPGIVAPGDKQAETDRLRAEEAKLKAETAKLTAEAAQYSRAPWFGVGQSLVGFGAIAISVLIGFRQIAAQQKAQEERARVDALLKAAEIAMNAPASGQVRSRARILATLLEPIVPHFGESLKSIDLDKFGFASWRLRFTTLLEVIGSKPEHARMLVEVYNTLFPDNDQYSQGRISALIKQLTERDRASLAVAPSQTS